MITTMIVIAVILIILVILVRFIILVVLVIIIMIIIAILGRVFVSDELCQRAAQGEERTPGAANTLLYL